MKRYIIVMALLMLGIPQIQAQSQAELYNRGITKFESRQYPQAEQLFLKVLENDPTYAPAAFQLAQVYLRLGDMDRTQEYIRRAIDTDPENQEYRATFDRINEINAQMSEGNRYMNSGDYEAAFEAYQKVLEKFPFFATAAYSMGVARFRDKKADAAVKHFQKALQLNPNLDNARTAIENVAKNTFNDGNQSYKRGDLEGALAAYHRVLEFDSTFFQADYQIGVIKARMGDFAGAVTYYTKALDHRPDFYKGWYALGLVQEKLGHMDAAITAFEEATRVNPQYSKAYAAIGEIHLKAKRHDQAVRILQTAVQVDPTYSRGYEILGVTYIELERYDLAAMNLENAVIHDEKNTEAWYRLSKVYNLTGDCKNAARCAQKAVDLKPNFAPALVELGIAEWCHGQGNKVKALNLLERARNDREWRQVAEYEIDRIKNPHKYQQ